MKDTCCLASEMIKLEMGPAGSVLIIEAAIVREALSLSSLLPRALLILSSRRHGQDPKDAKGQSSLCAHNPRLTQMQPPWPPAGASHRQVRKRKAFETSAPSLVPAIVPPQERSWDQVQWHPDILFSS